MTISLIGETEFRPILYALMKICQSFGDVLVVAENPQLKRFIEEPEEIPNYVSGYFQNTFIVITDKMPDEAQLDIGYEIDDYEYVIYVNKLDPTSDLVLYIQGCEMTPWEENMLGYMEEGTDYHTIHFGFGKNNIPYTANMWKNCEICEAKRVLIQIDGKISAALVKKLSPLMQIPEKTLQKAVSTK